MEVIEPGHRYRLNWLDDPDGQQERQYPDGHFNSELIFVNREDGTEHAGTQTQEVLRALIDRTQHCDACLRWGGNDAIVFHLRAALILHEQRALGRKLEKGLIQPESVDVDEDGHFLLSWQAGG